MKTDWSKLDAIEPTEEILAVCRRAAWHAYIAPAKVYKEHGEYFMACIRYLNKHDPDAHVWKVNDWTDGEIR